MTDRSDSRRRLRRIAIVAPGALIALGVAWTLAVGGASADPAGTVRKLRLVEREVSVQAFQADPDRLAAGDRITIASDILTRAGRKTGVGEFTCTVTLDSDPPDGICIAALELPGGQITGSWAITPSGEPDRQPITGGSGVFRGARGQFVLDPALPNGDTPFTVELVQ